MTGRIFCVVSILAAGVVLTMAEDPAAPLPASCASSATSCPAAPAAVQVYHWQMADKDAEARLRSLTNTVSVEAKQLQPGAKTEVLTVTEKMSIKLGDKQIGYEASVRYALGPKPAPVSADCKTFIQGKEIMAAQVKFENNSVAVTGTIKADKRGNPLDVPKEFRRDLARAAGPVVFCNALVAAPRLLDKPGQLNDVVVAEFPDDIDEPLNLKEGYTLTRGNPAADGSFEMKLVGPSDRETWRGCFDGKGVCLRMARQGRKLVPAKQAASAPASRPRSRAVELD